MKGKPFNRRQMNKKIRRSARVALNKGIDVANHLEQHWVEGRGVECIDSRFSRHMFVSDERV